MSSGNLSGGRINLAVLRESYRRELLDMLDKCEGFKALVWDDALTGPFGLIAEYTLLKEHEVERMFPLQKTKLPSCNVKNIIFICRPKYSLMDHIAYNVAKEEEASGPFHKEFHIFFVPRKSLLCEKRLKELGVHGSFTSIEEYCLDFIPIDSDCLSMEMESSFRQCYLEDDHTTLFYAARALMTIQSLFGLIPNIYGKGVCADKVIEMIMQMRRELAGREPQIMPQIDNLFIIDRTVDPLTPLMTQLTYEGLLDEIFGIYNSTVKLPPEKFNTGTGSPGSSGSPSIATTSEPKKLLLNSTDELFSEIRDRNFNAIGNILSRKVKLISAQYDERHAAKTVGEMKQFVSKLPHMQAAKASLSTHTTVAELIKEVTDTDDFRTCVIEQQEFLEGTDTDKAQPYIEDCIAKQEPLVKVLRLICIQSFCNSGLKPKLMEYYKREIIQTYGYQHLVTLHNLEKVGLLKLQGVSRSYPTIRKTLKLVVKDVDEQNPNDFSYVYSGYAPLSVKLAHILHRPGWRSITEVLDLLPGRTREEVQQIPGWLRMRHGSGSSTHSGSGGNSDQKVTLVFFLGGVTYAEIAAFRFLSQLEDGPAEYIIATTKLINGSTWIESLMDTFKPKPPNPF